MTPPITVCSTRQILMAMVADLRANCVVLTTLVEYYGMFRSLGGIIPRKPLSLDAMTFYQKCPSEEGSIPTAQIDRYRFLAQTISDLGQATFSSPRSLRDRKDIADDFNRASSEMREVGTALDSAVTILVEEPKPSLANP